MDDALKQYRQHLVDTLQKVSESYDKTVITLSGGALGVSFTYVKDFIGANEVQSPRLLFWSWVLLTISLSSVLFSLFFGTLAFRKAIRQVDDGTIYENKPGGGLSKITIILHSSGATFLLIGLLLLGCFVYSNLGENGYANKTNTTHSTSSTKTNATQATDSNSTPATSTAKP